MIGSNKHLQLQIGLLAVTSGMLWFASGCGGSIFYYPEIEAPAPLAPGMSRIIFMKSKGIAFDIPSSIFEVVGEDIRLVGVIGVNQKVAYDVAPGEHLFMVVGVLVSRIFIWFSYYAQEQTEFMSAMLEEGKTYYVEVLPRRKIGSARFELRAIHRAEIDSDQTTAWLAQCRWEMPNESMFTFAERNSVRLLRTLNKYRPRWYQKDEADRSRLELVDGVREQPAASHSK